MSEKKQSKRELFLELAQPDDEGFSRAVETTEFVGKYERQHRVSRYLRWLLLV